MLANWLLLIVQKSSIHRTDCLFHLQWLFLQGVIRYKTAIIINIIIVVATILVSAVLRNTVIFIVDFLVSEANINNMYENSNIIYTLVTSACTLVFVATNTNGHRSLWKNTLLITK